jgi:hypothetical protein
MVELVRLYSNPQARPETLLHLRRRALSHRRVCEETAPLVPQRVDRRLGHDLISRVVSEYAGGISTTRLAKRYGIGKGTLLRLIRVSGVTIRKKGPQA